jgi:hypothetical protein
MGFRSGGIAVFAVGCFLLAMLPILLGAGGIGAIKSGNTQTVAEAVLGGLYAEALIGAA